MKPADSSQLLRCGSCSITPPPFERTVSLLHYSEPARHLVRSLKFHSDFASGFLLGSLLAKKLSTEADLPELIIPVPLHPHRFRTRGFNQAIEIARPISRALDIPLELEKCRRVRRTRSQSGLPAKERRKNIKNVFETTGLIPARRVAIVDDVVTTGTTVSELSRILAKNGVRQIHIWACAKA